LSHVLKGPPLLPYGKPPQEAAGSNKRKKDTPMKKGILNKRGASNKKLNEAIINALPRDKNKRVAPIPVANARTKRRNPSRPFLMPYPVS
jgi:hypothetical protein